MKIDIIFQLAYEPITITGESDILYRVGTILKGNGRYFIVSYFHVEKDFPHYIEALMETTPISSDVLLSFIDVELVHVTDEAELSEVRTLMDNTLNLLAK
jgi:hypothetical protein